MFSGLPDPSLLVRIRIRNWKVKKVRKTLTFTILFSSFWLFLLWMLMLMYLQKVISKKSLETKLFFVGLWRKKQDTDPEVVPDLDPLGNGTSPRIRIRIRIRTEMSWIHNTVSNHRRSQLVTNTLEEGVTNTLEEGMTNILEEGVMYSYIVEQGVTHCWSGCNAHCWKQNHQRDFTLQNSQKYENFPENSEVTVTGSLLICAVYDWMILHQIFFAFFAHLRRQAEFLSTQDKTIVSGGRGVGEDCSWTAGWALYLWDGSAKKALSKEILD